MRVFSYTYDQLNRLVQKSYPDTSTVNYAYDGDNLVEETNGAGGAIARYSQGLNIDEPLAMLRSGTTNYYQADGLGSVTSLSNTSGALAQTYTRDSFGNQIASSGSITNPFQYTGREFDTETSLYYYRARYYDPSFGRFISEDPIRFDGGSNFYQSVFNDPVDYTDSRGLKTSVCCRRLHYELGKLGFAHCYIRMNIHGGASHTYGLHREDSKTGKKFPEGAKPIRDDISDVGGTCKDVPDATPCKELDFERRYNKIPCPSCGPDFNHYFPLTTNSNFWVYDALTQFDMTPPLFFNAPGYYPLPPWF